LSLITRHCLSPIVAEAEESCGRTPLARAAANRFANASKAIDFNLAAWIQWLQWFKARSVSNRTGSNERRKHKISDAVEIKRIDTERRGSHEV
jgi:hypothetical protein